jgi:chromosomal replication initiation ATPase DnaA
MKREDIDKWCSDNNFVLLNMKVKNKDSINSEDAIWIAEKACNQRKGSANIKTRKQEIVFARALVYDYLNITTDLSFASIGFMMAGLDHATVIHGLKTMNTEKFMGWRKDYKDMFENKINEAHVKLGFKEVYV